MTVGDPNRLVVTVPTGTELRGVGWEVLDTMDAVVPTGQPSIAADAEGRPTAVLPFSVYDSVGLLFPPLPVYTAVETLFTNDVALLVDFAPTDGELAGYRGIDAEPLLPRDWLPWVAGIAIGLLAAGAIAYGLARRARREAPAPPPPPPTPAHVVALQRLDDLRVAAGINDKTFYSRLDRILRAYLEDRYAVPALESTSSEVVGLLRDRGLPDTGELAELLGQVDLVKFARAELPPERRTAAVDRVSAFVRATVPPPSVATDGAPAQADGASPDLPSPAA